MCFLKPSNSVLVFWGQCDELEQRILRDAFIYNLEYCDWLEVALEGEGLSCFGWAINDHYNEIVIFGGLDERLRVDGLTKVIQLTYIDE
jgi:hypothetical protein